MESVSKINIKSANVWQGEKIEDKKRKQKKKRYNEL